jgi:folate-binding protein YgfZ
MSNLSSTNFNKQGITRLSNFALLRASGADAVSFLQSQLTNDIASLGENRACLAGYCTPKGRLLATMLAWKTGDAITIEVPQELQENLQKRLQLYVMRAKVKLEHISATQILFGVIGDATVKNLAPWFPELPHSPYELVANEHGVLIRLTDSHNLARYQCVVTTEIADAVALAGNKLLESDWLLSEIHAGIPQVTSATLEKFVPQMLNYELIGGVNFKKGCYPGQEIVARTHYLGKQKRRTVLGRIDAVGITSGTEVFANADPEQPCGMIVNAEKNNAGGTDCLIEIKTSFLSDAIVQLSTGEIVHWLPMPYPLLSDGAEVS